MESRQHLIGTKDAPSILAELPEKLLLLVGNFSNTDADVTFPGPIGEWRNYFTGQNETVTEKVTVPANHFILYTRF